MKLASAQSAIIRGSIIDQIEAIEDKMRDLKFNLEAHQVDPEKSELMRFYEESKNVLHEFQGALLTTGVIEYEGELK